MMMMMIDDDREWKLFSYKTYKHIH